jgi:spore coat protein A
MEATTRRRFLQYGPSAGGRPSRAGQDALHNAQRDRRRRADLVSKLNGVHFDEGPATETPRVGTVEDRIYVNMTADTHPMHITSSPSRWLDGCPGLRGGERGSARRAGRDRSEPFANGPMERPHPSERGFKDTVKANPGHFTTIRANVELPTGVTAPQRYVYHCHIVEHEDNDMMRPITVEP